MRQVEAKDVGKIFKIRVSNDETGIGAGWYLDRVEIKRLVMAMVAKEKKEDKKKKKKKKKAEEDEDEVGGEEELREVVQSYLFPCDRWLASDEEDGEIVVELLPEDSEELEGTRSSNQGKSCSSKLVLIIHHPVCLRKHV